jgi:serine/threonine-protein kinase RsbW
MFKEANIRIGSSLTELFKIEEFVEKISDLYNINSNYYSTILLSLDEAVRNAIEHGNQFSNEKHVNISFVAKSGRLIFVVTDQGIGYSVKDYVDPTDVESTETQSQKRGLFLINHLADEVSFNEKRNSISIHFMVSSINQELAVQRTGALKKYFKENFKNVAV